MSSTERKAISLEQYRAHLDAHADEHELDPLRPIVDGYIHHEPIESFARQLGENLIAFLCWAVVFGGLGLIALAFN